MVLDFEYGINTGNRFIDLVDHDEDPDVFIASKTQSEEKSKRSSKDSKQAASKSTKKTTTPSVAATSTTKSASITTTTKPNKENVTGKPANTDQRRQQQPANVPVDNNNNQQPHVDSGRGGRGSWRRGGSAGQDRSAYEGNYRGGGGRGQDRPAYEGNYRGGSGRGQDRPAYEGNYRGGGQQRFNKFENQPATNEISDFEQSGDNWENQNQNFGGYRGRGRGRGGPRRGFYEGGRGRGGRGHFVNRNNEEGAQETTGQQPNADSNVDSTLIQSTTLASPDANTVAPQPDEQFESNEIRRGRGPFRPRVFRNNRNYGGDRQNQYEHEGGEGGQENYRQYRRQHDRQPRSYSGVKPVEKKDGAGAHNYGKPTENPEEARATNETTDAADQTETEAAAGASKGWAEQVDEAEKQMTLDEYKKQLEAKKQAQHEKVPQFNRRTANEGEDPKNWQNFKHVYRKKNDEEGEEGSEEEENESEEEIDEENTVGKKKIITIPLRFKPVDLPRGGYGGPRRGAGRVHDRSYRDDYQTSKAPNQQQGPSSQQTGEYKPDEQQQQQTRPYGGPRQGSGRGEYRRTYRNSTRGDHNRSTVDPNKFDFANTLDFPILLKEEK
ncbi:unnamed protein product [Rotaria magnacalcarata]|uniref:Hyaluronan/mRNA-binding protein domain-containing protein n=3 Tax=Rotaria magnacalcarata TaxID=392030 RepID=A0A816NKX5_9BILA|nr:unnamed protein product [Rotaria magnacalcarata]